LLTDKHISVFRLLSQGILKRPLVVPDAIQLFTPSIDILKICCENIHTDEFLIAHLAYYKEYDELLDYYKFKKLFIIRDPRGQLIFRIFYMYKHSHIYPKVINWRFDEFLFKLIGEPSIPYFDDLLSSHVYYKGYFISNILSFYNEFLQWRFANNCYTIKFEDLVGPKAGDEKRQI